MVKDVTRRYLDDLLLLGLGALGTSVSVFSNFLPADVQLLVMILSLFMLALVSFDVASSLFKSNVLPSAIKQVKDDRAGLAWVIIVGLGLSIPACALFYWVLDYPFDLIASSVANLYTFTGAMAYAWITTKVIINYLLAFCLIYSIIWIIVNSKSPGGY